MFDAVHATYNSDHEGILTSTFRMLTPPRTLRIMDMLNVLSNWLVRYRALTSHFVYADIETDRYYEEAEAACPFSFKPLKRRCPRPHAPRREARAAAGGRGRRNAKEA